MYLKFFYHWIYLFLFSLNTFIIQTLKLYAKTKRHKIVCAKTKNFLLALIHLALYYKFNIIICFKTKKHNIKTAPEPRLKVFVIVNVSNLID